MNPKISLVLLILITVCFMSCQDDDAIDITSNEVMFSFSNITEAGRVTEDVELDRVIVTVEDASGSVVFDGSIVLNQFDDEYESEPLSLQLGAYNLTEFLVLDTDDVVRYATPIKGSELAHLVGNPLPIGFDVNKDDITHVVTEVVKVFQSFDLQLEVFVLDYNLKEYELTEANVTITNAGDTILSSSLFAATNKLVLSDRFESVNLIVEKSGYTIFEEAFTIDSLKQHDGTTIHGSLEVVLEPNADLTSGLIAHYPFNGNANDESENTNDGTVYGAILTNDRNGNASSAYNFDGIDDFINLGNSTIFDFSLYEEFTLSVWIESNRENVDVGETIIGKYDSYSDERGFQLSFIPTDQVGFTTFKNGTLDEYNRVSSTMLTDWSQLTITKKNDALKLYVNGELVDERAMTFPIHSTPSVDMEIGATHRTGISENLNFEGSIDDIRIYNRAFTAEEVQTLHWIEK